MQMTPVSFWLRIVSSATAVLPVWRSPMISSRWPRPIGTMPSMAFSPVCSGSRTGCRSTTPGASRSMGANCLVSDRALAVDRLTERVDHAAEQLFADRHRDDAAGALDRIAFLDLAVLAEEHAADAVFFEVERDAEDAVRELEHLAGHRALAAVQPRDAVAERRHRAHFGDVDVDGEAADLLANDLGNLVCFRSMRFGLQVRAPLSGSPTVPLLHVFQQPLLHLLQLRSNAAVVHRAADVRDDAADERRIDRGVELHLLAGHAAKPGCELLLRLGIQGDGRRSPRHAPRCCARAGARDRR